MFDKIKLNSLLKIMYLLCLVSATLYVKSILDTSGFKAKNKPNNKDILEIQDIVATVLYKNGNTSKQFTEKLKSNDTVEDLLSELRKNNELIYEKEMYTYGSEISSVYNNNAGEGKIWAILLQNNDLTNKMGDEYLVNNSTYIITQVDIPSTHTVGQ